MKKLLSAAGISLLLLSACNSNDTKETTEVTTPENSMSTEAQQREKEINDSTKMLDKKLADPNSTYSPDSLKK